MTTKLRNQDQGYKQSLAAFDTSVDRLGLDYVDLYLIHWPLHDRDRILRTWEAVTQIAESGRAKSVGVCNFEPHHLQWLIDAGAQLPSVNQVELHPNLPQHEIRAFSGSLGIAVESWSPLGGTDNSGWGPQSKPNTLLTDPVISTIAARHRKSPAQVLIRWHLQSGLVVIPKSVRPERVRQNIDVFAFELSAGDLADIAGLDNGTRVGLHPDVMNFGSPD
ncbi:diketogulonate reductase-like aldo/keto reductase [Rhodococcus sp. 27YEA15]